MPKTTCYLPETLLKKRLRSEDLKLVAEMIYNQTEIPNLTAYGGIETDGTAELTLGAGSTAVAVDLSNMGAITLIAAGVNVSSANGTINLSAGGTADMEVSMFLRRSGRKGNLTVEVTGSAVGDLTGGQTLNIGPQETADVNFTLSGQTMSAAENFNVQISRTDSTEAETVYISDLIFWVQTTT